MKKHNREILKRVIPLVLAAVMVFGTLVSVIGSIVASAADISPLKIESVLFSTPAGSPLSESQLKAQTGSYLIKIVVTPNSSKTAPSNWLIDLDDIQNNKDSWYFDQATFASDEEKQRLRNALHNKINMIYALNDIASIRLKLDDNITLDAATSEADVLDFDLVDIEKKRYSSHKGCENFYNSITFTIEFKRHIKFENYGKHNMNFELSYYNQDVDKDKPISVDLFRRINVGGIDSDFSNDDDDSSSSSSGVTNLTPGSNDNRDDDDDDDKSSSSEPEKAQTTPKVIITGFDAPEEVNPGDEFDVTIRFRNNSQKKKMENLSVTISPPDGISILNGTNKKHYIQIPKREIADDTFHLKASKDLKLEAVPITFKFEFQYLVNGEYKDGSSEEIVSIGAIPKEEEKEEDDKKDTGTEGAISSFEILSVIPPADLYPNEDGYLTVNVINKDHQYDASNVQLSVTGDGLVSNGNVVYHGSLAHSSLAEIEMPIQFSKPGTYTLEAIVTYEDAEGFTEDKKPIVRINDVKREFTVTVNDSPDQMGGGMDTGVDQFPDIGGDGMYDDSGMPVLGGIFSGNMKYWIIGGGAVGGILVIVLIVQIVRHANRKKEEDDENL